MAWFKRVTLFLVVNLFVMLSISLVLNLLGVGPYLTRSGIDFGSLAAFCLVWGMGGSFISLLMSRQMAKWKMGVEVVDPNTTNATLRELVQTIHRLARKAGMETMPQVGIYESSDVNAFATGPSKKRSLVAVSTGLLGRMGRDEVEGVLGHEVAHIANGDMVTMTLLQGVVNAFVMFLARVISFAIANMGRNNDNDRPAIPSYFITWILESVLMVFGSMVVFWFSRYREFRADEGGARLAGKDRMVSALTALQRLHGPVASANEPASVAALKISGRRSGGLARLFSTHPPLEERIQSLLSKPIA